MDRDTARVDMHRANVILAHSGDGEFQVFFFIAKV